MNPPVVHRLPAPLETAVHKLKLAARSAVERSIESLGLAALTATSISQRQDMLAAQAELNRRAAAFAKAFNDAFDERLRRDIGWAPAAAPAAKPASWDTLRLVDDHEVETEIAADRFALEVANTCEWELRELDAYVGSLLGQGGEDAERNPLRPAVIGHALYRGVEAVSDRPELQKVLGADLVRSLSALLRQTYADIVSRLRQLGVEPLSLAVRQRSTRTDGSGAATDFDTLGRPLAAGARDSRVSRLRDGPGTVGGASGGHYAATSPGVYAAGLGSVDATMMALMRRLAQSHVEVGPSQGYDTLGDVAPPNMIRAHRSELREAAKGALDHMVIDVIGSIFDQILSDPKVPPQIARQIARLQLPVLRAALGDSSFFASRRHPVRRFVNRIASLGAAFDDFEEADAREFLHRVRELVQEVVDGEFDQIQTYEVKLSALEALAAELARKRVVQQGLPTELLDAKEDELRLRALYASRLGGELRELAVPPFLHDFLSQVWSQVLLRAAAAHGGDGEATRRLKEAARELCLSVQPKPSPAHRKAFLAELPKLMRLLTEGMDLVGWPEAERRAFFGRLMPAHAEALKTGGRQLDFNLVARKVESALALPIPSRADLADAQLPVLGEDAVIPELTPDEARRVGLVDERSFDWDGKVDIDVARLNEEAEVAHAAPIGPLPSPSGPPEPTHGRALAETVQVGFAYQMHLDGQWHKVRLAYVSPGRTFFVFIRGQRHERAMSLTHRMLARLCESGRLRAFESAYLIERATARARRQLSSLAPAAA